MNALAQRLSTRGHTSQQWKQYASKCVQPGLDLFRSKFCDDSAQLKDTLDAFKAARLSVLHRLVEINANTTAIDSLAAYPFLNSQSILNNLKLELPTYLGLAQDTSPDYDTLNWWKGHCQELPYRSTAAHDVLVQSSSASSERVFTSFGPQQDCSLQDYNNRVIINAAV